MYQFDAYFNGQRVYINKKRQYTSNEVLTQLLNMDFSELPEIRRTLVRAQYRLKLEFDMNLTDEKHYSGWVRKAQSCMYRIDAIAQSISLYADNIALEELQRDKLLEVLSTGAVFFAALDDEADMDDCRMISDEDFYLMRFVPDLPDAPYDEDMALRLEEFNQIIAALFQRYIGFVDDLLVVQTVFGEFVENHIHTRHRFPNEFELAQAYSDFVDTRSTPFKSGRIDLRHAVLQDEQGRDILCEVYHFENLVAFLYVDFFKGLAQRCIPNRCYNCRQWFLLRSGKYADYCEQPLEDNTSRTCRDVGKRKRYVDKCNTDPVWQIYNRAYKQHYARYLKKKMTVAEFEKWSAWAVEVRGEAERGTLELEEYRRQIRE